jgi:hypothetical protein
MRIVRALTVPLFIWSLATALLASLRLFGAQVTLAWDANTETDIVGYKVWYSSSSSTNTSMDVGKVTSATLPNLSDGTTYTFFATAYNSAGLESGPSTALTYTTPLPVQQPVNPGDPTPTAPTFIVQPPDQMINVGATLQLSTTVLGGTPMTFQWFKDWTPVNGATATSLTIPNAKATDSGLYWLTASNALGKNSTRIAIINVVQLPVITTQPTSQTLNLGAPLDLSVAASSSGTTSYQWFRNGAPIQNGTGANYHIGATQLSDAGTYAVKVTGGFGAYVMSQNAVINILSSTSTGVVPTIVVGPNPMTVRFGSGLSLSIQASGSGPLNYQWFRNGSILAGATSSTFQVGSVQATDAGTYTVQVSNSFGSVTSAPALVIVDTSSIGSAVAPTITVPPVSKTIAVGTALNLSVGASGSPLNYQWFKNGVPIENATGATIQIASARVGDSGTYIVQVSNAAGTASSAPAEISVLFQPVISVQPAGQSVLSGSRVEFQVQADGSAPLQFQWHRDGTPLQLNGSSSTYVLPSAALGDAGAYTVTISNAVGSVTSYPAQLTVSPAPTVDPPLITVQPLSQTAAPGTTVNFSVQASGSAPLNYQWSLNGNPIPGATSSILSISGVQSINAGSYTVSVSNSAATAKSSPAILTITSPTPTITTQPAAQNVNVGSLLNLSVVASGAGPLIYQWFHNGIAVSNATSSSFQAFSAQPTDAGQYYVKVSNTAGSVNSFTVNVTVNLAVVAPGITIPPTAQTVALGSPLTLAVEVTGSSPMQFQWYRSGIALPNGTSVLLQIPSAQATDSGTYTVNISNPAGSISSPPVLVTIVNPPVITQQPQTKSVVAGSPASLAVTASGSAPLSYQWLKNGSTLPGQTGAVLNIASVTANDAGNYSVSISNGAGNANSSTAILTVTPAPTKPEISMQPLGDAIASGNPVSLSVTATGTAPLQYQWYRNGLAIPNAQSSTFQIATARTADSASYSVSVSNGAGSVISTGAVITVLDAPTITQQPQSKSVTSGSPLSLAVTASGSGPLSYQWFKNGAVLANATSAILDLGMAESAQAGNYYVAISNGIGGTNSATGTVTVTPAPVPPRVSVQPLSQTAASGEPLTLSAAATGSTPLQYQWFRNGVSIQNATTDTFRIDAPKTTDSALYTVKISNAAGSATSEPALISFLDAPAVTQQPQSKSVTVGSTLNLAVSVSGSGPLTYQWFKDGALLPGATGATLDLGGAEFTEAGRYYVTISNPVGSTNSTIAAVLVTAAPDPARISVQPLDQIVASGRPLRLSVVATGSTPLQYQWFRNGVAVQNENKDTLQIDAPKTSDTALYTVKVSNSAGAVTSTTAAITVLDPLVITQQPQSKSVTIGSPLNLGVAASGSTPMSYQWFKDGAPLPAATSSALDLGSAVSGEAGEYYVTISNPVGSTNSRIATVLVTAVQVLPRISVQPLDQMVASGKPLTLSVVATGSAPLQYQWLRNGGAIENANSDSLKIDAPQTTDSALYSVKISNTAGSVTSAAAVITVLDPLIITEQPESQSVSINSALNLTVAASGSAPLSYQWFKDGALLAGATGATLDLGAAQSTESGEYSVNISNPVSSTKSMVATVTIIGPVVSPDISIEPFDQTITSGTALTVSVGATGSAPLRYQWFRNGLPLQGANANTFQLASPRTDDSGSYAVTISNSAGSRSSRSALISVFDAPSITVQPQSKSVVASSPLTLTVIASGSGPLSYQWLRNGVPISGATSATLNLGSAQPSLSGDYTVRISNMVGNTTSSIATVSVTTAAVAPGITAQPVGQTVAPGGTASLSVQASGTNPLQYQWYRNSLPISNATGPTLLIPAAQQADAATYTVQITNAAGSTTSAPAIVTIDASLAPPIITVQPVGQNLNDGSLLNLSVQASGANLAYQWFHDGILVPTQPTANYQVSSVQISDAGTYNARISNSAGSVTSAIVNVTVTTRPTPPSIVKAPVGQTVTVGSPITLSVQASGSAPLQFQWFRNGRALQNGTSATLQIAGAQALDAGDYAVNVANAGGSVSTDPVTVTVILPPAITQQPASKSLSTGDSLALTVVATSQSAMTYQWYRDGVAVPNATGATLQISSVQRSNAGGYLVRISNAAGTVTSAVASVTVSDPTVLPSILTQPASQTLAVGSPLSLSVQASGTGPLQYQWYRNAVAIQNANSATFQKPAAGSADAASYTVKISNSAGSLTSSAAVMTVLDPPVIMRPPSSQTVAQGSPITLTVQASGAPTLTYRWFRNGTPVSGANSASYPIGSASTSDNGIYTVQITNGDGTATSSPATVTVTAINGPAIVSQPGSQTVLAGSDCSFIVGASGPGLRYQWSFNGTAIPNGTNALLRLVAVDPNDAGDYTVSVSNSTGSIDSQPATLAVNSPPVITSQPVSQTASAGAALTLRATASGSDPLRYQWLRDGFAVPNATNATLQIGQVKGSDAGSYVLRVSNDLASVNSQPALLVVLLPPSIVTQPTSQTLTTGKPVTFTAQAMGVGPLQYQWLLNGSPIPNATSSSFQIASAQTSDAGIYTLQVSNAAGSVTSDPAILGTSIANQFAISKQPLSQILAVGSPLNLSVQITGGLALQYQWFRNGVAIGGGTSPNLKISSLQTSDAGSYALRITSSAGILMSDPAIIRVVIRPGILVQPASQSVTAGSSVTLLVQASGSGPLQYQWSRDMVLIPNATDSTFKIPSAQTSDAGVYSVNISNEAGLVTSQDAVVSILVPPLITTSPASRSVAPGSPLDLSVQATGSAPLLYQWFRNGVVIPNATSSTLHFDAVSPSDAGSYAVSVGNPAGMVSSTPVAVGVIVPPAITSPPQRQVLPVGAPLLLTVGFTGFNAQFQWFRDAFPLPGATNSILEIPEVDFEDQGAYRVTISNKAGAVTSSPALVVVLAPPSIVAQPLSLHLQQGTTATFSVVADGSEPLSYQWFRNGAAIAGATTPTYSFAASTNNAGSYHVDITNPLGTVSSVEVTLTVSNGDLVTPPAEPRVEITYAADADLVLETIGEPGTIYDLQSADQIPPTQWTTVSSAAAGADGLVQFTATNPKVDSKFYRVIIHNP